MRTGHGGLSPLQASCTTPRGAGSPELAALDSGVSLVSMLSHRVRCVVEGVSTPVGECSKT